MAASIRASAATILGVKFAASFGEFWAWAEFTNAEKIVLAASFAVVNFAVLLATMGVNFAAAFAKLQKTRKIFCRAACLGNSGLENRALEKQGVAWALENLPKSRKKGKVKAST